MTAPAGPVRTRFCPSPTGTVHVGVMRAALYNWAYARHTGGQFVVRIEDTDPARNTLESERHLLDCLRWLGLTWDEGPEVGGPHGPYRQSERSELYQDVAAKLLASGHAYESFSTNEEVDARRRAAGQDPKLGYDNADRFLTDAQKSAFRAEGREPVLRLRMPEEDLAWTDHVRGEVRFAAGAVPDFVLVRGNGTPLYTLVNPVDDALMGITDVLRGEDLLPSTPRQIALYRALTDIGVATGTPRFGHLPLVMGEGNKKLSKRDPQSNFDVYRDRGFLPAGLVNYLALLGWSIAEDRDIFSPAELAEAFDVDSVSANPARFDLKKAEAINATHLRALPVEEFLTAVTPYLVGAGLVADPPTAEQAATLGAIAPLAQERMIVLSDAVGLLGFLFTEDVEIDPAAAEKQLGAGAGEVLDAATAALQALPEWTTAAIETALKEALVEGLGRKPRQAFGPVRVAVSGRTVSPPLYESMELLGRERTLTRLAAARGTATG
ncbi:MULTISPECIES: glutamate--tRNA ligase [unclassified Modestobacter]|uniref:glutamate--tRNA ligase n=1 Tax=unclassified Modestobacter TaxID=2643866 RepID=UPI0022AAC819|nr:MULTISPECIES: glutamate--tRNA ligase [unclassified Modestobacter]MCZ2824043.1 glutamate--tRNA ligase [Modestobacter sp. VKM Ac-2981]MCZ2852288.1 glutamate--tRNA ligase [Modestobacter sp. VKM Ac-2982]